MQPIGQGEYENTALSTTNLYIHTHSIQLNYLQPY